jgi:hypothetical protein
VAARVAHTRGQALPEMVIVFPLAVILLMGIVQLALLYRAKATVNNASFLAARSGSLNNGFVEPMEKVFLQRMAALGKIDPARKGGSTTAGYYANPSDLLLARVRSETESHHDYGVVEILFPSRPIFNFFAVSFSELEPCSGSSCPGDGRFRLSSQSVMQIPNNNLDARDRENHLISGKQVTLQDANLLSIKTRFCYALEVPVANFIIWRTYGALFPNDPEWQLCRSELAGEFAIPLVGHSVVRMQSPFRCEGDLEKGIDCENI